tara:strand:+ start:6118 stop:6396 length:279 start_codon:yes stop_codon:yes gene_type:complete
MPDYDKIGFKNKLVDRVVQNDSIPKATFKRFNIPLYTGRKPGTKQDSITYKKGFAQGIKNFQKGKPNAIGLGDSNNFHRSGKKDGVDAMKKN